MTEDNDYKIFVCLIRCAAAVIISIVIGMTVYNTTALRWPGAQAQYVNLNK